MNRIRSYVYRKVPIGKGQYATVYKGHHIKSKRPLAIKVTRNLHKGRREAQIMKRYRRHRHLARLHDFFIIKGTGYTVMEWFSGTPIGIRERRRWIGKKRSVREASQICLKLLYTLRYLHRKNIRYRDINPSNILIINRSHLKFIDFGGAKHSKERKYLLLDLYLAGYLLYFLVKGNIRAYHRDLPLLRPRVRNARLQKVLRKAMHPNPRYRFQSADQFIRALRPFVHKKRSRKRRRRRK